MKILVIQLSRFGDLLQTTPMLRALRVRYPRARITVLSRYKLLQIYRDNPNVDHVELFDIEEYTQRLLATAADLFAAYAELKDAVMRLRSREFDLVLNATHDRFSTFLTHLLAPSEIKGMHLSARNGLRISVQGFWFKYLRCTAEFRETAAFNLVDIYKNTTGGELDQKHLFFHLPPTPLAEADRLLGRLCDHNRRSCLVGFQLGTSTGNRRWPSERFAALGDLLQQDGRIHVVLLGSKEEQSLGLEISNLMRTEPLNLIGKTDIPLLGAVLKRCTTLVTNDTGTMHLAAAVGTPCVALFLESANPHQTGPYGSGHIICAPNADCFPCPTTHQCDQKDCLLSIDVATVFQLVENRIGAKDELPVLPLNGTSIYKTEMAATGSWIAWPLTKAHLRKNDFVRESYRMLWLRYSRQIGEGVAGVRDEEFDSSLAKELHAWAGRHVADRRTIQSWRGESSRGLLAMEEKGGRGLELIKEIFLLSSKPPFDGVAVKTRSWQLGLLDREIVRSGKSNIWLTQLTSLFELELSQIEDSHFLHMLDSWRRTYQELMARSALLKKQIDDSLEALKVT